MEFAQKLGVDKFVAGIQSEEESTSKQISWGYYELFPKMQENMYYELQDTVGFSVVIKTHSCATEVEKAEQQFRSGLNLLKRKSLNTEDPKTFILVAKNCRETESSDDSDSEENSPPYLSENYEVLWIPNEYTKHYDRILAHTLWGEGENSTIQCRLAKGTVDAGNLKMQIIRKELNAIQIRANTSSNKEAWREAFSATLALTKAAILDVSWMYDNDYPERVADLVGDLASYWRTSLLKKKDEMLGIGINSNQNGASTELSEARKALYLYLRWFELNFLNAGCSANIKFNWKPTRTQKLGKVTVSKKRKRSF